ncbi:TPA: phage tail protein [Escherichia coli]|nr:phage tail protein [Escherichia coli]HAX5182822.1 phage tail protein [Escherichia coli]HAX5229557.1 phage tail protein [Escherichia coli]
MHRIDTLTAVKDKFGPGKNGFTDGNLRTGRLATWLNSAMWDAIQEEICGVIEKAGIELNKEEHDQLYKAILLLVGGAINEEALLIKNNLSDVEDKDEAVENLGLKPTVDKAKNAVQRDGDTMSGNLTFENDSILAWIRNTDWAKIGFKNNSDDDTDSYMWFHTGDNGNEYFKWRSTSGSTIKDLMNLKWDALYVLVNAVISGSLSVGTTKKFTWSSGNSSTKNAGFNLWGNSSRPVVAELGDDSGWHFYSQRNTDDSITFAVNGQIAPGNWSNFDARYAKSSAIVSGVRLGSIASYTPGNETTWTKNLGNGNVLTGIIVQDTGKNSADNIGGIYYRPVQYCINGSWVAASSI